MADTTTIGGMTLVSSANMTGAAKIEVEDSTGASAYSTLAILRTKLFAGGTGYTASDPLVCGTVTATSVTVQALTLTDTLTIAAQKYVMGGTKRFALADNTNSRNYVYSGGAGGLAVNNQADSATILTLSDAGNLATSGTITAGNGVTVSANGIAVVAGTSSFQDVTSAALTATKSGATAGTFNRTTSNGQVVAVQLLGQTCGELRVNASGEFVVGSVSGGLAADVVTLATTGGTAKAQVDTTATAGNTALLLYCVDTGTVSRVKTGAAGTGPGGSGRALYV